MGRLKRAVRRVLQSEGDGVGRKNFAGDLWNRLHGLDDLFEQAEGCSVLDIASCEGLISYEFARHGARLVHGFERDKDRVRFSKRLFRDVPIESEFVVADVALSGTEFERRHAGLLLPRYDIVLFLGIYHHIKRHMKPDDLADMVRFLAARTHKWLAVRTFEDEALEATVTANGLRRIRFEEGIEDVRGPLMIYARADD